MSITAATIILRARSQLVDTASEQRWSDTELLRYLTDAQRTIVAMDASATATLATMRLQAGTRQTLPADGNSVLDVIRNMGTLGTTPGRAIRVVSRDILDSQKPDWHSATQKTEVVNYVFDPADEKAFYVWPPSNGLGYVQINYSVKPTELTELTDVLEVDDLYVTALTDYVMYRAHQKDSDFSGGENKANSFLQSFVLFMNGMTAGETQTSPNQQFTPFNPSVKGAAK